MEVNLNDQTVHWLALPHMIEYAVVFQAVCALVYQSAIFKAINQ